jgi:hypothetical protein
MSDFIGTFLNMAQLQNQQEQTENARKSQAVQGVNTFMTIARQTADPALLTGLVDRFAALGVAPKDELLSILQHVTPTQEALKAYSTRQGMLEKAGHPTDSDTSASSELNRETANTELTGMNEGQMSASAFLSDLFSKTQTGGRQGDMLAASLASRTAGNVTPGQLVLDHAMSLLPQNEIEQGAGIGLGTRMSAPQDATNQLGWANLREENRKNTQYGALTEAGFHADLTKAGMAALKGGLDHIPGLLQTKEQFIKQLTDAKGSPTPALVMSIIGGLNSVNQQLTAAGIANEGQIQYKPEMLTDPTWLESIRRGMAGSSNIQFAPVGRDTTKTKKSGGR